MELDVSGGIGICGCDSAMVDVVKGVEYRGVGSGRIR
jgi:hypothetical protein